MINTSNSYQSLIYTSGRKFCAKATITFKDETVLNLDDKDIMQGGVIIDDAVSQLNSFEIGSEITVNINRASGSFTHKVDYVRPDGEHVRIGEDVGTSCTFTPSLSDANFIPNSTSAMAKIYVYTYSGSTYIGSSSKNFTLYVPSSVVPTINSVTLTENTS